MIEKVVIKKIYLQTFYKFNLLLYMNVSNLSENHQKLLAYMKEQGYCESQICWVKKCIRAALSDGAKSEIGSYEQLYWYEIEKWAWKEGAPSRRIFKSTLCCVKQFDLEGKYPNNKQQTTLDDKPSKYDLLCADFKALVNDYTSWAATTEKRDVTIRQEKNATVCFFTHLQERERHTLSSVTSHDVISFFFNKEERIRGRAYISKITPVLKHAAANNLNTDAAKVIGFIPKIKMAYPNYQYLNKEEASKVADALRNEDSAISLLDRALVTVAYYTGMRGTDISSLSIDNIDWNKETITFVQSKTGVETSLPLTAVVGNAVWRYITMERPECQRNEIFVNKQHPFGKVSYLWRHFKKVFNEADVRTDGSRTGVRIFRHHLATSLLANEVATPVVSSILGHVRPESVYPYIDADIEHLRECALDISNYPIAEEVFEL